MKVITVIASVFLCVTTAFSSTSKNVSVGNNPSKKSISATVTAYTPAPRENGGRGKKVGTAIGTRIRPGIVAVSRDLLRSGWDYGDKVHIKGLGVFIIEDTMHSRFRRTIDVAVPDMAAAQKIGKLRNIEVTLLESKLRPEG
jgi:3D (Asp-Asp-Asp) domain-containing protein